MNLQEIFNNTKLTENGDIAYNKVSSDVFLNILFMTEYYQKHLNEVPTLGYSDKEQLFAMFIRDPRFGLGRRDLGRKLLSDTGCTIEQIVQSGRVDDLFFIERFDPVSVNTMQSLIGVKNRYLQAMNS